MNTNSEVAPVEPLDMPTTRLVGAYLAEARSEILNAAWKLFITKGGCPASCCR